MNLSEDLRAPEVRDRIRVRQQPSCESSEGGHATQFGARSRGSTDQEGEGCMAKDVHLDTIDLGGLRE
jgi:hypothetical protein